MLAVIAAAVVIVVVVIVLFWTLGIAAALIGAVIMGITTTIIKIFIVPKFEARDRYRLASDNVRLSPEKLEVRFDNLKNGYVVDCFYTSPETGRRFVFSTEPFPNDPTPYLGTVRLTIVTNRIDYSNYYVETADLKDRL